MIVPMPWQNGHQNITGIRQRIITLSEWKNLHRVHRVHAKEEQYKKKMQQIVHKFTNMELSENSYSILQSHSVQNLFDKLNYTNMEFDVT